DLMANRKGDSAMLWLGIGLGLLAIAGWIIYSRRKRPVTLTENQAQMVLKLVRKERAQLKEKINEMVEHAAAKGANVSLDDFSHTENLPDHDRSQLERMKQELLYRYGPKVSVDVFERFINQ